MFEGKLVKFRPLEEEDLVKLKEWRNSHFVKRTTREYRLLNMFNQRAWFESLHTQKPPHDIMFGITNKKNNLLGVCGLTHIDWKNRSTEISIYLEGSKWQNKKETKDAVILLLNYGFGELGLHRIFGEVYSFVKETISLFESLGFKKDGVIRDSIWRNRKWWNSYIYSMLDKEFKHEKDD